MRGTQPPRPSVHPAWPMVATIAFAGAALAAALAGGGAIAAVCLVLAVVSAMLTWMAARRLMPSKDPRS